MSADPDDGLMNSAWKVTDGADSFSSLLDSKAFKNSVIGIVATWGIKTFILEPAAIGFGLLDWAVGTGLATLDGAVRTALRGAGRPVWAAFLGPTGAVTIYQETLVGLANDAGIAAPVATAVANLLLLVLVGGSAYLGLRALAGYVSGGVLS